jgi:DNA polymerase-3 subunit delta'
MQGISMHNIFPWQIQQWHYLKARLQNNTFPHAILLSAPQGMGKTAFAHAIQERLLCAENGDNACGKCQDCTWLIASSHPDLYSIYPEDNGKNIKIEQIRSLVDDLTKTSQRGRCKVVIINPAEAMNISAANALLKTLEEPTGNVIFILVSHQIAALPATIRSRCQIIKFNIPSQEMALHWLNTQTQNSHGELVLKLTENIPLQALALAEPAQFERINTILENFIAFTTQHSDPLKMAELANNFHIEELIKIIWYVVIDLIKLKMHSPANFITNQHKITSLAKLSQGIDNSSLFHYLDFILAIKKKLQRKINLNSQLLLEQLFISWQRAIKPC